MFKIVVSIVYLMAIMPAALPRQPQPATDTSSLAYALKKGQLQIHARYFFMATDNAPGLTGYVASAAGTGIKYETGKYKGFRLAISGFSVFNAGSGNLTKPDPITGQASRYEIGLFDITNAKNKNINRLEELNISYSWKHSSITAGKQLLNTPFINPQDGRMNPTTTGAIWAHIGEVKRTVINTGFIYELQPRSTSKWYPVGQSIGLYTAGVHTDGTKAQYAGNIKSKGIAILGLTHTGQQLKWQVWDMWVENIFNNILLQAEYNYTLTKQSQLISGIQFIGQQAIHDGGNSDPVKTYYQKRSVAYTAGARLGWEGNRWKTSLNYNRITAHGRYLVPREWGREPFFTFLPRERNEGTGDVDAWMVKAAYSFSQPGLQLKTACGYYRLPDVTNYTLNKYGLPSYGQLNIEALYKFKGWAKGLEADFLFVWKKNYGDTHNNNRYVMNKVDMQLWNVIIDYRF